jgi:hypothetical protein
MSTEPAITPKPPAITQRYVMMGRDSFDAVALNENPDADLPRWRLGGPEAWVEYTYTNNFLTGARVIPPEEAAVRFPHPFAGVTGDAKPEDSRAVHEAHCFQGDYAGGCKYGDGYACPAAPDTGNVHDARPVNCRIRLRQEGHAVSGTCSQPECSGGFSTCIGETAEQRKERISYELECCGCGHPFYEQGEHSPECSYHG